MAVLGQQSPITPVLMRYIRLEFHSELSYEKVVKQEAKPKQRTTHLDAMRRRLLKVNRDPPG